MPGTLSASDAAEMNRWLEIVYRLALDKGPSLTSGSEPSVVLDVSKGFWARIDTSPLPDGRHGWQEVHPIFEATNGDIPIGWVDGWRSSTVDGAPAYEANGGLADNGDIVFLHFAPDRQHFLFTLGEPATGGGALTVKEADGTPTVTDVTEIRANQATGLLVSQISAGIAQFSLQVASATLVGIVDTGTQTFAGNKTFRDGLRVGNSATNTNSSITFVMVSGSGGGFFWTLGGSQITSTWQLGSGPVGHVAASLQLTAIGTAPALNLPGVAAVFAHNGTAGKFQTLTVPDAAGGSWALGFRGGLLITAVFTP